MAGQTTEHGSLKAALDERLGERLQDFQIPLPAAAQESCIRLLEQLVSWNKAYNLTAIRDPWVMIDDHLIDSLLLLPYLEGVHILDLGTGAGFPGLPLAIACPDKQFTLLDSNLKKIRFVRQATAWLGLDNVTTLHQRMETYQSATPFDTITCRAFTQLPRLLGATPCLIRQGGLLLLPKGEGESVLHNNPAWSAVRLNELPHHRPERPRMLMRCWYQHGAE